MLHNRIALITGASRGIGAAVAKRFAAEGAHVILVARDSKGLEATDDAIRAQTLINNSGGAATLIPMDLRDASRIEQLAAAIAQRFGRLDILVGNAGVLSEMTPLPHVTPEDWDKVMQLNVTANWQLIRCFDALLKASSAPRALFVTSGVTARPSPYWGPYAVSKAALEAMVRIYAAENDKSALRVNLVDPGRVRTRMRAQAYPGEDALLLPEPDAVTDIFVTLASAAMMENGQTFYAQEA